MMLRALLLSGAVLALGAPALAAPVVFTDRAAFEAAVDALGPTTEGFESFEALTQGALFPGNVGPPLDGLTITSPAQFVVRGPFALPFLNPSTDGVNSIGSTFGLAGDRTLTFTFDAPVNAFGLDLIGLDTDAEEDEIILDAFGESFVAVPNGVETGSRGSLFFGIVNDMGQEATFAFTRAVESDDFVTFDAVATAAVADVAVPAPAALALFGLGALALGLARRARG